MPRFEDSISILLSVIFRKCVRVFQEFSCLLNDFVTVATSTISYSTLRVRQPFSSPHFTLSLTTVRLDRHNLTFKVLNFVLFGNNFGAITTRKKLLLGTCSL